MGAEESDRENSGTVLDRGYQSVVVAFDVENNSADLRMLAFGYDALMSSGVRQLARVTMSSQASYCDRAALMPLWLAWSFR